MRFFRLTGLVLSVGTLALCCSCASTNYETQARTNFVDRKTLENVADEEISSKGVDMQQMKRDKKLNVGVRLTVRDESQGRARLPDSAGIAERAYRLAENYLSRVKAYNVVVLNKNVKSDELMTGKDFEGVKYHFMIDMYVTLNSEIEERLDIDEAMYKTSIEWRLIDNRTKSNGGNLDAPKIKAALTCQNITTRKLKISSVRGGRMGGSELKNAQNAFQTTVENSMIEFRGQLADQIPFGGNITKMREKDGKFRVTLNAGTERGITDRMQMLIIDEDQDPVAIGTVTTVANDSSSITIWRWISKSQKEKLIKASSSAKTAEDYLEESPVYAVSLGVPTPNKNERTQINF